MSGYPQWWDSDYALRWCGEHGVEVHVGINWTWAIRMDEATANAFVEYLDVHGVENRGVSNFHDERKCSVRFR